MNRRNIRVFFLLLLFTLQTFSSAFAGVPNYTYDLASNLLSAQSNNTNGLASDHSYDLLNRLATTSDNSVIPPYVQAYTYDAVGNLFTSTGGNGLTHRYSYSDLNRLTHLSIGALSDPTNALSDFSSLTSAHTYTLNQAGQRTVVEDFQNTGSQTTTRTVNYTYDSLYRLTEETITSLTAPVTGTVSYTHDQVGNRRSRTSSNSLLQSLLPNQTQAYNANDQLTDRSYDANGNTTQSPSPFNSVDYAEGSSVNDVYDFPLRQGFGGQVRNKLIRRTLPDGSTIDLHYNADALLIAKRTERNGSEVLTNFLQDTNNHTGYAQIVEEGTPNGTEGTMEVFAINVFGHDLLHTHRENPATVWNTQHYLYDGLGSIRALTDDAGQITDSFDYDAFGTLIESTGDTPNAYLYTGERFDPDLGFYYLRARYHDTNLGRFHTLDTYEGRNGEPATLHKYLYTHADPVNGIDPSGNLRASDTFQAIAASLKLDSILQASVVTFGIRLAVRSVTILAVIVAAKAIQNFNNNLLASELQSQVDGAECFQCIPLATEVTRILGSARGVLDQDWDFIWYNGQRPGHRERHLGGIGANQGTFVPGGVATIPFHVGVILRTEKLKNTAKKLSNFDSSDTRGNVVIDNNITTNESNWRNNVYDVTIIEPNGSFREKSIQQSHRNGTGIIDTGKTIEF